MSLDIDLIPFVCLISYEGSLPYKNNIFILLLNSSSSVIRLISRMVRLKRIQNQILNDSTRMENVCMYLFSCHISVYYNVERCTNKSIL